VTVETSGFLRVLLSDIAAGSELRAWVLLIIALIVFGNAYMPSVARDCYHFLRSIKDQPRHVNMTPVVQLI
jgi:hypothetical protein